MKKITALFLILILSCTIISCGNKGNQNDTTNELSQEEAVEKAYESLSNAHELMSEFDSDIYTLMKFASTDGDPTIHNLAQHLNVSEDEFLAGFVEFVKAGFTDEFNEKT